MIMLFSSSKSMTWIYRHKERAGQKLTHFPLAFTGQRLTGEPNAPWTPLPVPYCTNTAHFYPRISLYTSQKTSVKSLQSIKPASTEPCPATPSPPDETSKAQSGLGGCQGQSLQEGTACRDQPRPAARLSGAGRCCLPRTRLSPDQSPPQWTQLLLEAAKDRSGERVLHIRSAPLKTLPKNKADRHQPL